MGNLLRDQQESTGSDNLAMIKMKSPVRGSDGERVGYRSRLTLGIEDRCPSVIMITITSKESIPDDEGGGVI